jgi:hypothetical protein
MAVELTTIKLNADSHLLLVRNDAFIEVPGYGSDYFSNRTSLYFDSLTNLYAATSRPPSAMSSEREIT